MPEAGGPPAGGTPARRPLPGFEIAVEAFPEFGIAVDARVLGVPAPVPPEEGGPWHYGEGGAGDAEGALGRWAQELRAAARRPPRTASRPRGSEEDRAIEGTVP